jgi:hypothetical protein
MSDTNMPMATMYMQTSIRINKGRSISESRILFVPVEAVGTDGALEVRVPPQWRYTTLHLDGHTKHNGPQSSV